MIWLTKEQVIYLHSELIKETGGLDGLRDEGLLESSIIAPLQTYDSDELFPSAASKAARLAYGLTQNHPFIDGNKRIGAHAMLLVLKLNGVAINYSQKELADTFLGVASGAIDFEQLHEWVISHLSKEGRLLRPSLFSAPTATLFC